MLAYIACVECNETAARTLINGMTNIAVNKLIHTEPPEEPCDELPTFVFAADLDVLPVEFDGDMLSMCYMIDAPDAPIMFV